MADETYRKYHTGRYGIEKEPKKEEPKSEDRKVDIFAGEGSLADKLRKRRKAIEGGDPSGSRDY